MHYIHVGSAVHALQTCLFTDTQMIEKKKCFKSFKKRAILNKQIHKCRALLHSCDFIKSRCLSLTTFCWSLTLNRV